MEFHAKAKTPYAYDARNRTYLAFEDARSIAHKVAYARAHALGGLMVWALNEDDDDLSLLRALTARSLCADDG